jgi:hypothetical protein
MATSEAGWDWMDRQKMDKKVDAMIRRRWK